jgi:hypothetical protein
VFVVAGRVLPFVEVFEPVEVLLPVPVFVLETVAAGDGDGVAGLLTLVFTLLVALLAGAASPQAIPSALIARTDESAITFFITNSSLLSFSKNNTNLCITALKRLPQLKVFEANVNIEICKGIVNLKITKYAIFFDIFPRIAQKIPISHTSAEKPEKYRNS